MRYDPSSQSTEQQEEVVPEGAPGTVLEVKHLHEVFDYMTQEYIIKPALPFHQKSSDSNKFDGSKYTAYAFTVIRKFSPSGRNRTNTFNITTELEIHSKHLIEVGQGAIGQIPGISWTAMPLRVCPHKLQRNSITFLMIILNTCHRLIRKYFLHGFRSCKSIAKTSRRNLGLSRQTLPSTRHMPTLNIS